MGANKAAAAVGDRVWVLATEEVGVVVEITRWGGREELIVDLPEGEVGFTRVEVRRLVEVRPGVLEPEVAL